MKKKIPVWFLLAFSLAGCTVDRGECGTGKPCASGEVCVTGQSCEVLCASDGGPRCPSGEACVAKRPYCAPNQKCPDLELLVCE